MSSALRTAYLVPDTTLFIQCKELSELDWSAWNEYDEIHVIVTRPVQKEIDNHKNTGNDRVARRSRKAASRFRTIILGETEFELIEPNGQTIKLILDTHDPDPELKDKLDYSTFDNALVGTVRALAKEKGPNDLVQLLAHDMGPLMSARSVGVSFVAIPDEWFLDPEPSADEKKITQLEERIRQLEKAEPNVTLCCIDQDDVPLAEGATLELNATRWLPLTKEQLASLLSRIETRFPMKTKFDPPRVAPLLAHTMGFATEYVPAKANDIKAYREVKYPSWLRKCEVRLRSFRKAMQQRERVLTCAVAGRNDGSRPAEHVVVSIEAKGPFTILRAKEVKIGKKKKLSFPQPPNAPEGVYIVKSPMEDYLRNTLPSMNALQNAISGVTARDVLGAGIGHYDPHFDFNIPRIDTPWNRDPESFYFAGGDENKWLGWECARWRHGKENYCHFEIAIFGELGEPVDGLLDCKIQAANLSSPAVCRIPIKIRWQEVSAFEAANELVDKFVTDDIPGNRRC